MEHISGNILPTEECEREVDGTGERLAKELHLGSGTGSRNAGTTGTSGISTGTTGSRTAGTTGVSSGTTGTSGISTGSTGSRTAGTTGVSNTGTTGIGNGSERVGSVRLL